MRTHGFTPEQLQAMRRGAARAYGISFFCFLVTALVLAVLGSYAGIGSVAAGVRLGVLCWLGFAATIGLTATLYSGRRLTTFAIDAGYQLAYMAVMGAIIGGWQ